MADRPLRRVMVEPETWWELVGSLPHDSIQLRVAS
jgi:hypothetical protein